MNTDKSNFRKKSSSTTCLLIGLLMLGACSTKKNNDVKPEPKPKPANYDVTAAADGKQAGVDTAKAKADLKAVYTSENRKLVYQVSYAGIAPESIDIYAGTPAAAGNVLFNLKKNKDAKYTSPFNGEIVLTADQEKALLKTSHINFTSAKLPKGHIRGKLQVVQKK